VRLELAVGVEILAESRIWVPLGSELIVIELAEES
jgi:hypothetical protein